MTKVIDDPSGAKLIEPEVTCSHVYRAINAVMVAVSKEGLSKDRKNDQQGYKFRGIDDAYNLLCGILANEKLMILPRVIDRQSLERPTKTGGISTYSILTIEFDFISAVDGSKHTIRTVGEAMDTADKSSNKAQSAAMKYACLMAFMIPTKGDNDADASTPETAQRPPTKTESDPVEQELTGLYTQAATADDVATADATAAKHSQAKRLTQAARSRLLPLRAQAIARVSTNGAAAQ